MIPIFDSPPIVSKIHLKFSIKIIVPKEFFYSLIGI